MGDKLKAKKRSKSPGDEPKMSPGSDNPSAKSAPSVRTPPKASGNGPTPVKTPGKGGGVKKTVTFGVNTAKGAPSHKTGCVGERGGLSHENRRRLFEYQYFSSGINTFCNHVICQRPYAKHQV